MSWKGVVGKKSGTKRSRRHRQSQKSGVAKRIDAGFEATTNALKALFAQYNPADVALSLSISDLWLPNISSQVKHALAFATFISMPRSAFSDSGKLDSYENYRDFIDQVHEALPSFPTLEDYVPELDWGEILYPSQGRNLHIFYGGAIERIPDFITAFGLAHNGNGQAIADMHLALVAQDHIIAGIERTIAGTADDIRAGHMETPSADFWRICSAVLRSLSQRQDLRDASTGVVTKLGMLPAPKGRAAFGDAIFAGSALPAFLVEIDGRHFPLALRNAPSVVIDRWAQQSHSASPAAVADFLKARFEYVVAGPLKLVTREEEYPSLFSAAIAGGVRPYLVIIQDRKRVSDLSKIEAKIQTAVQSGDWALRPEEQSRVVQLRKDDSLPTYDQLCILAVLSDVGTDVGILQLPKTKIRVLPLPDFVTIFDSIGGTDELDRYWSFIDAHAGTIGAFAGAVDRFAAFRDSHGLLAGGAVVPTMIALDPHWGSTWRHKELVEYWKNAPPSFPDHLNSQWTPKRDGDGLYQLVAKRLPALSWCAVIDGCVTHFVLIAKSQDIKIDDGRILELTIHCLADSLNQRQGLLASLPLFCRRQIVTTCFANTDALASQSQHDHADEPLFSDWRIIGADAPTTEVEVCVNLQHVLKYIADATDAAFEVGATIAWIEGISAALGLSTDQSILMELQATAAKPPRFTLKRAEREVDVPDFADPIVPDLEQYKIARRDLALTFKRIGVEPGKYELEYAKPLIDQARDDYRTIVHQTIGTFDREELVRFCIEQLDKLATKFDREQTRTRMSLTHDVGYDRSKHLAEEHEKFVKDSRNYRYLLEARLSMSSNASGKVSADQIIETVARVDWLQVLYNASDVLHNGIDVAGLEIDSSFIPEVYYSQLQEREDALANESADMRLGIGLTPADEVAAIRPGSTEWSRLDDAFDKDAGLRLSQFIAALSILFRWSSASADPELRFIYSSATSRIVDVMVELVKDLSPTSAQRAIDLATLRPDHIRRLLGKSVDEIDVPVWEHIKRGDRYMLKPVIVSGDKLIWGAAAVERAARIWRQSLAQGYMPADFDWPNVKQAAEEIKNYLESQLEVAACRVLQRATLYVASSIDFARRFKEEKFEDVGDFDGLAYFPELNHWISVECKYNQPAFCLKDARRLRERIFGRPGKDRGHFDKIERRTTFLRSNANRLSELLEWPPPHAETNLIVDELYVSRDIYWWMRNPPYAVMSHFVRVDALEGWLRNNHLFSGVR
jgi:hypothetical protein